jgi:hypothetical protein
MIHRTEELHDENPDAFEGSFAKEKLIHEYMRPTSPVFAIFT